MSEENVNGNADDQNLSTEDNAEGAAPKDEPKVVPREAYEKVMADLHKYKKQVRTFEQTTKEKDLAALKEKQDWQKIAEIKEREAKEATEARDNLTRTIVQTQKHAAIKEQALKSGILETALDDLELLNWNDVKVETTSTGRIVVDGAEDAISRLKTLKPHWFGKSTTNVNSRVPSIDKKTDIVKTDDLVKMRKEAMKSGDYSAYEAAFNKYKKQSNT